MELSSQSRQRAAELLDQHGLIDLHIDTLIPPRLWGADPRQRHELGLLRGFYFGHLDLPRLADNRVAGAMWSITTNPFRTAQGRWKAWQRNLIWLERWLNSTSSVRLVKTPEELAEARSSGVHALLLAVQGANAWDAAADLDAVLADGRVTRATLVHLTDSQLGATSSPLSLRSDKGLRPRAAEVIAALNRHRAFVDLAHIHPVGFWQALALTDRDQPPIATHTGVTGVSPHWRNLDDAQIRAIADRGGVVGVMAARNFLAHKGNSGDLQAYVAHLEHVLRVGGAQVAAVGTDLDGAIVPPAAMRNTQPYVALVAAMAQAGWPEAQISAVCQGNFATCWQRLRPPTTPPAAR